MVERVGVDNVQMHATGHCGIDPDTSPIITRESPIATSACITNHRAQERMSSVAPNACCRNSINRGTHVRRGMA